MKRKAILFALVVGTALAPLAQAKAPVALKSVSVTFPQSTRTLPDDPGLATAQGNCLTCHSAGMILAQPRMPKAAWVAEVAKMRNVYKARVDEKDVPAIVDYLTAIKGPK
jgi:mono/diheme cytochrome c family protein